jgi:hypothetical protein
MSPTTKPSMENSAGQTMGTESAEQRITHEPRRLEPREGSAIWAAMEVLRGKRKPMTAAQICTEIQERELAPGLKGKRRRYKPSRHSSRCTRRADSTSSAPNRASSGSGAVRDWPLATCGMALTLVRNHEADAIDALAGGAGSIEACVERAARDRRCVKIGCRERRFRRFRDRFAFEDGFVGGERGQSPLNEGQP